MWRADEECGCLGQTHLLAQRLVLEDLFPELAGGVDYEWYLQPMLLEVLPGECHQVILAGNAGL